MGYKKIPNLYKDKRILEFKRVYALEKIDGSWWSVQKIDGQVKLNIRGIPYELGVQAFNLEELQELEDGIIIYGEGYGGKIQGMSHVYGDKIRFVAFDVYVGHKKLCVPDAEELCRGIGLDFVPYKLIDTDIDSINSARDEYSRQAEKNGMGDNCPSEGIVLRPPFEVRLNNDSYLVAKHKNEQRRETKTKRSLTDEELKVLRVAQDIAEEWVTPERLRHVSSAIQREILPENIPFLIQEMLKDIEVEAEGEIVWTRNTKSAISRKTANLVKEICKNALAR